MLITLFLTAAACFTAAAVAVSGIIFSVTTIFRRLHQVHGREDLAELINDDYRDARRAMNDAAGQSWRNLVD